MLIKKSLFLVLRIALTFKFGFIDILIINKQ